MSRYTLAGRLDEELTFLGLDRFGAWAEDDVGALAQRLAGAVQAEMPWAQDNPWAAIRAAMASLRTTNHITDRDIVRVVVGRNEGEVGGGDLREQSAHERISLHNAIDNATDVAALRRALAQAVTYLESFDMGIIGNPQVPAGFCQGPSFESKFRMLYALLTLKPYDRDAIGEDFDGEH